jgi:hypothetical protein
MIRPLLTAIIEYVLAFLVFKYGKVNKNIFSLILFLLATYQLGEVLIFLSVGNEGWLDHEIGFKIAYVATTLLPPLGVLLVEKIRKKKYGYPLFQLVGLGFAIYFLIIPAIALKYELGPFCVRVFQYDPIIANYWGVYYQSTLFYSMGFMLWGMLRSRIKNQREILRTVLLGYLSFNALTFIISYFVPWLQYSSASLMCALALIAAFIFTKVSLAENLKILYKRAAKFRASLLGDG